MKRLVSVMLAAFALGACSDPTSVESDIISAQAASGRLNITNNSDDPVYYFAADREALALIDWAPCQDPARCNAIPPHSTRTIAFQSIAGYQTGSGSALVYHWKLLERAPAGYQIDSIRYVIVSLR